MKKALVLVLLCVSVPGWAQRWHAAGTDNPVPQAAPPLDDLAHVSWTRRDGAPSDITALAQTADGYLWVGSSLGLHRFDGLKFSAYPFTAADPPLLSSDIAALAADPDGGLWIGYRMGGITYLHGGKKIDFDGRNGLVSESTEQLVCLKDGSVWATADGRLMHLRDGSWENYSASHGLTSEGLFTLFFDSEGNLWTAEKHHLYELKRGSGKFQELPVPNQEVNQFAQLRDGTMWISDAWSNVRPLTDQKGAQGVRIPGVPVMLADTGGNIWLAHDFGGLTRIVHPGEASRKVENYKAANGLTDGQTRAILEDHQGAIWVGTARGLDRFQHSPLVPFHGVHLDYFPALIAAKDGGVWLNDMDKPLMRLRNGSLTATDSISHGSSSLFQDDGGGVWLLDPISHDFFRYPDNGGPPTRIAAPEESKSVETWCIGTDDQGMLLASFEGHGLWRHASRWQQVVAPGMPHEAPLSLMKAKGGGIWLGYPHNQAVLKNGAGFHVFDQGQGLALNAVLVFYELASGMLTGGSDGLAYFDGHEFHSLQVRSRNLLRGISGIVKDRQNDLWLNGASGVIHIPAREWTKAVQDPSHIMEFQILNERDGLIGAPAQNKPTPSAVMDKDGLLWFATSGHLVSVDPASIRWGRSAPNVLMQAVLVNGSVYKFADHDQAFVSEDGQRLKSIEFDYIGIDLDSADRVTYQYMLEGQDSDWQDAGARGQAFYTNLSPASYRFRVRATNGTGRWNELNVPVGLTVRPAFYQTSWFRVLCGVLLASLLWLLYQRRVRYLTTQVQERLEARAYERLRIARDLHDTLLQGVQGLILRFHFATEQLTADEPVRELLRTALSRADSVINEGREKVRELRSDNGSRDLPGQLALLTEAMQLECESKIQLLIEGEAKDLDAMVQDELFSIAREALTNAVRHAHANKIEIRLAFERSHLRLVCADDGCGVSQALLKAGFKAGHYGIVGMRERAARLGCELEFWSSPGVGTKIEARVTTKTAYVNAVSYRGARLFERLSLLVQRQRSPREAEKLKA